MIFLLSYLPPHYPKIFFGSVTPIESYKNLVFSDIITSDHFHNSWNVIFSSECGEEKTYLLNFPNLSSYHSKELEGKISCFPSSPLYHSFDHEDSSIFYLELSDRGLHDIFTCSSDHDSDFSTTNFSTTRYDSLNY